MNSDYRASFMRMRRKRVPREPTPPQHPSTPPDKIILKGYFQEKKRVLRKSCHFSFKGLSHENEKAKAV
jgi:hypothetical protein